MACSPVPKVGGAAAPSAPPVPTPMTTSKEYLTNGQILLKYSKFVFLQLHLVKISCKLITIRLSYERNKKSVF